MPPEKRTQPERVLLEIKVVPGASRDEVAGWLGAALKVRVTAPPERGRANAAVEEIVAEALGVPRDGVRVVRGTTSPRKTLEIRGVSEPQLRERLGSPRHGDR
jgi:hypothetical protein